MVSPKFPVPFFFNVPHKLSRPVHLHLFFFIIKRVGNIIIIIIIKQKGETNTKWMASGKKMASRTNQLFIFAAGRESLEKLRK
jgi:hypothetical protein